MAERRLSPDATPEHGRRQQGCTAPHPGVSLLLSLTAFVLVAAAVVLALALS